MAEHTSWSRACNDGMHDACIVRGPDCLCVCHGVKYDPTNSDNHAPFCDAVHNPHQVSCEDAMRPEEEAVTENSTELAKAAIEDWWLENAKQAIEAVAPKAAEYGSTDLAELGRDLAMLMNRDGMSHEELTELGIYMYMLGKFSRWRDAIKDGRRVSLDTIYDIKVYATMAERNRAVGGWPFPVDHEEEKA